MGKTLSDEFERQIRDVVKWVKSQPSYKNNITTSTVAPTELNVFRNNSGETAPAYAVMEVEDSEVLAGRNVLVIKKPTGDSSKPHVINGPRPVSDGERGRWFWGTTKVAITGTPTTGAEFGVTSGDWTASSGGSPIIRMMGELETGYGIGSPLAGSGNTQIYQATVADTINPGESGVLSYRAGNGKIRAENWSECQVTHGDRVFLYVGENGVFFTPCRCCTGEDYDCCDTSIWVCVCGDQLYRISTNGDFGPFDVSGCCSGSCSVSSTLEFSLSCTGGTITGSVTQTCDDGGGSSSDTQALNSTSLSALCDTDTPGEYLTALAFPIGFCNPSIKFYNYEPTDCATVTDCDFDSISTLSVTIAGVDSSGVTGCNANVFNAAPHSLTKIDPFKWSIDLEPASPCCQMNGAILELTFWCDPASYFPGINAHYVHNGTSFARVFPGTGSPGKDYGFTLNARGGINGTCCLSGTGVAFYADEADVSLASIDTGTVSFPGRTASIWGGSLVCNNLFNETGSWSSVTVRVQSA